jgi:hypothetical protein
MAKRHESCQPLLQLEDESRLKEWDESISHVADWMNYVRLMEVGDE